jgi:hypothetical protein
MRNCGFRRTQMVVMCALLLTLVGCAAKVEVTFYPNEAWQAVQSINMAVAILLLLRRRKQLLPAPAMAAARPIQPPPAGRRCMHCGQDIRAEARFCPHCGQPQMR